MAATTFLQIVQRVFRRLNRQPPTTLASPNNYTQMVMDAVTDTHEFVGEIAKKDQWDIVYGSNTFTSVSGTIAYTLKGATGEAMDVGAPIRRIYEQTTPRDLASATKADWFARTQVDTNGTPEVYRVASASFLTGDPAIDIELDPIPNAAITYTYEYVKDFSALTVNSSISLITPQLGIVGATAQVLRHKGQDSTFEQQRFGDLLAIQRDKQQDTSVRLIYGDKPEGIRGIQLPGTFSRLED